MPTAAFLLVVLVKIVVRLIFNFMNSFYNEQIDNFIMIIQSFMLVQ